MTTLGFLFLVLVGLLFGTLIYLIYETEDKLLIKQKLRNEKYLNRILKKEFESQIDSKQLHLDLLEQLLILESKSALSKKK